MIRFLAPADVDPMNTDAVDGAGFVGVTFDDQGVPAFYYTPRLPSAAGDNS